MAVSINADRKAAFVTDNINAMLPSATEIGRLLSVEVFAWEHEEPLDLSSFDILVVDVDLKEPQNVVRLKDDAAFAAFQGELIYVVDISSRAVVAQAHALNAKRLIGSPLNKAHLMATIIDICRDLDGPAKPPAQLAGEACLTIADLMDDLTFAIKTGEPLPVETIHNSCETVIDAILENGAQSWLKAVRGHSSYTYRHIMTATGLAALFGVKFGMARPDVRRLTLGALMHDVGKVKVPIKILDKPGALNAHEKRVVREHPVKGADLLIADGRFEPELVSIVRSHHEMLDGSGYPDGLHGAQISDIVRIITIVDTFSALIETRSYKASLSMKVAYGMLRQMGGKLDQDIVQGFEPIALDRNSHALISAVRRYAA